MKPPIYLTDPKEMRRVRLNQPLSTLEQRLAQEERLRLAAERFSAAAKKEISSRGRKKTAV